MLYGVLIREYNNIQMIHTFSPNWYKPQCLLFHKNNLYYASNYVLYKYNLQTRRVETDKCLRKIAIKTGLNSKDIKIHSIRLLSQQWLLISTNQPHAIVLDRNTFNVVNVLRNIGVDSVHFCQTGVDQDNKFCFAIFAGEDCGLSKVTISSQSQYKVIPLSSNQIPKERVKQILKMGHFNTILFSKGQQVLFDKYFDKVLHEIPATAIELDQEYVLSLDTCQEGEVMWAAMLTRTKSNAVFLHYWSVGLTGQIQFKTMLKSQVKFQYPKLMTEKVKNSQKAAMTIKFLNPTQLLLSGKLGQIVILNLTKCPEQIIIKPQSIDDVPAYLQILNDSKHYKQIYSMYSHYNQKSNKLQLYTVSTDQTMGVWNIVENSIQFCYNVKFITAELVSIFYGEGDPKTVFFLLKDSNIRSVAPLSGQSYFLNQYWKFTKKFKVVKAIAHIEQPGITAMVTDNNLILIYDLYDDRLMKIYDMHIKNPNDQIINITFQYKSIVQPLQKLTNKFDGEIQNSWKPQQIKISRYYTKNIKNSSEIGLLVQQKSKLVLISEKDKDTDEAITLKRACRIERIHNTKLWDRNTLLFSQYKNNNLKTWIACKGELLKLETATKLGGRCIFKMDYPILRVLEYKGKKVCIHSYSLTNQNADKISQIELELPVFSEQVVLDYHSCQAIFYNGKDDLLAYVQFSSNQPKVVCLQTTNKVQSLSFYFTNHIVVGFKDQSIKVLKLSEMADMKDQPHKKVKKTIQQPPKIQMMESEQKPQNMMSLQQ